MNATTEHRIHNETVKASLERYPLWRYPEFQRLIQYQAPSNPQQLRQEMVKLKREGWTEKRIAQLLRVNRNTIMKWLRHARQAESQLDDKQLRISGRASLQHQTRRNRDQEDHGAQPPPASGSATP